MVDLPAARPSLFDWRDPWFWGPPLFCGCLALLIVAIDGNEALFVFLNRELPGADRFWASLTIFGDSLVALVLLLPFCGRCPRLLWSAIIAALLTTLWIQGLKTGFSLPRPAAVLDVSTLRIIGPEILSRSFPSGHTATAFVLAGILVLGLRPTRFWRWSLLLFAGLVGCSRIAVGAHWPVDVLVGAASGWLLAGLALTVSAYMPAGLRRRSQRLLAGLLVLAALDLLLFHDTRYALAEPLPGIIALAAMLFAGRSLRRLFFSP